VIAEQSNAPEGSETNFRSALKEQVWSRNSHRFKIRPYGQEPSESPKAEQPVGLQQKAHDSDGSSSQRLYKIRAQCILEPSGKDLGRYEGDSSLQFSDHLWACV